MRRPTPSIRTYTYSGSNKRDVLQRRNLKTARTVFAIAAPTAAFKQEERLAIRILLALALAGAAAGPVFAQGVDAMTCAEFAKQDHTQQMATVAAIQAFTSQKQAGQQVMSDEIFTTLTTKCTGHDDMMVMDALK